MGLFSGVLCYLKEIESLLEVAAERIPRLILTRNWVADREVDEFYVQRTPKEIYENSSVFRLFARKRLEELLYNRGYRCYHEEVEKSEPIEINQAIYLPTLKYLVKVGEERTFE